ncbi:protein kinase [Myxococcus sp. AS-1-15]|uniref:serine/threonine-protein kinase n=1 Tax=Myxococcus sp. AS-1-15 TaxID=2874600 RepID=UPI00351D6483
MPARPRCSSVSVEVDPLVGTKLGSFRLVRRLGRGGMGAVYLGEHVSIGSRVAVKVLHEHLATYPELVQRFHAEARAVNVIGHENIVSIFDLNAGPPRPYLIMEYLDGAPLSAWVGSPLPAPAVVSVLSQVCDALQAAHLSGIVHRDLKPDNVFLVRRGRGTPFVKVLDFGIAKLADANMPQTHAGIIVGTPEYMAPEQSLSRRVDGRADLYALGVIAYQLVTGRLPFEDEGLTAQLVAHQMRAPPPPRSVHAAVPVSLERVILRALEKAPEQRYATAALLRAALEGALAEEIHVRSRQARPVEPAVRARSVPAPVAGPGPVAGDGRNALPVPVMLETDLPEPVSNGSVAPRQGRPVEGVKSTGGRPVEGAMPHGARSEEARLSPPGLVHAVGEVSTSGGPRPSPRAQVSQPVDARGAGAGARPSPPVPVQSPVGAMPAGARPSPSVPVQSPMGAMPPGGRPSPSVPMQSPMGAMPPGGRPSPSVPMQSPMAVVPSGARPSPSVPVHSPVGAVPPGSRPSPQVPVQSPVGAMPPGSRPSPQVLVQSPIGGMPLGARPSPPVPVQSPIGAMSPGAGPAPMQARPSVEARPEAARRPSPSPHAQARPSVGEKSAEARRPSPSPHAQARPSIDAKPAEEARRPSPSGMARPRTDEMPTEARRPSSPGSPPRASDVAPSGRPSSDRRDAPMLATPNHSAPAAPLSSGRSVPPVPTPKGVAASEDSVAPWSPVASLASRNWGAAVQNASGAAPPVLHPSGDGAQPSPSEVSQAARPRTVELPVRVVLRPGETPVWLTASDLSRGGLFLRSDGLLPPLFARLPLVLELESGPQSVVCEVVRHVPAEQAQVWGMPTGFGVQFVEATLALKSSVDALLRAGPGRRVALPAAASPSEDKEAARVLEAYRARLTGDHYAVLAVPPDLDMGSLRRCTREARTTLESLRQRPLSSAQSLLLDSVLTRLHEAGEVLGTVTQRALYDAWRGNHRGVARCLEAGLTPEQLESLRREFLTRRPQSAGMARVHYLSGSALEREGQLARALETYERGLALDPLESSLHHRYRSVRRALDARGAAAEPSNERARPP